jgi:hypothetical protein
LGWCLTTGAGGGELLHCAQGKGILPHGCKRTSSVHGGAGRAPEAAGQALPVKLIGGMTTNDADRRRKVRRASHARRGCGWGRSGARGCGETAGQSDAAARLVLSGRGPGRGATISSQATGLGRARAQERRAAVGRRRRQTEGVACGKGFPVPPGRCVGPSTSAGAGEFSAAAPVSCGRQRRLGLVCLRRRGRGGAAFFGLIFDLNARAKTARGRAAGGPFSAPLPGYWAVAQSAPVRRRRARSAPPGGERLGRTAHSDAAPPEAGERCDAIQTRGRARA